MAVQTGRTVSPWVNLIIHDYAAVLRAIPIDGISICGIAYDESDMTAWQDAVAGALPNMPDAPVEFTGPYDVQPAQAVAGSGAAPDLSGSHIVLEPIMGVMTPLSLDIQFGVRHSWEDGEAQFGITQVADPASGYILTKYDVDFENMTYAARLVLYPGSALPAFDVAAEA
jgi:hypothetical protein